MVHRQSIYEDHWPFHVMNNSPPNENQAINYHYMNYHYMNYQTMNYNKKKRNIITSNSSM